MTSALPPRSPLQHLFGQRLARDMIDLELVRRGSSFTRARIAHSACHFKRKQHVPSTSGRTAGERSGITPKGLQRGSRAL